MKLLLVSDLECKALWDYYQPGRLAGIDLIISCGDLKKDYLEFLVTMGGRPVFYVAGNHDEGYVKHPPEGCECIDDRVIIFRGLRIAGLGGCKKYSEGPYQFTEQEMKKRIRKLRRHIRRAHGLDILVTHAAIAGYGDAEDLAHRGFDCFAELVDTWHPTYMFHGHVHQSYGWDIPRTHEYHGTQIINAFERYVIEVPDPEGY